MGAEKVAQVGAASREGQHLRKLARWLVVHPAEEGLGYPDITGGDGSEVSPWGAALFVSVYVLLSEYSHLRRLSLTPNLLHLVLRRHRLVY